MRQKELRIALVCYGGISLAVYMHGVTKELWKVVRASQAVRGPGKQGLSGVEAVYADLIETIERDHGLQLRVLNDIVAGASAGGINGVFLAQAIYSGQSLEPLTDLWLDGADVDVLLDPDARPWSRFAKFWAYPIVRFVLNRPGNVVTESVAPETRAEVREKLSRLIRSRWFEPPFSGIGFSKLICDALEAMRQTEATAPLLPPGHPLDLFVTATDFKGHLETLRLHSPPVVLESEHRLPIGFRAHALAAGNRPLAHPLELVFAARATASFPGAFPALRIDEIDRLAERTGQQWQGRGAFLDRVMPEHALQGNLRDVSLIDGSVLVNAPFADAIGVLNDRPAHREVDRRFVYIDPSPKRVGSSGQDSAKPPGFFSVILGSLSSIPRTQPIRDNLEEIDKHSREVSTIRSITRALRPEVEATVEKLFGRTLFLDRPTPRRLVAWRAKAQDAACDQAGYAYHGYAQLKLTGILNTLAVMINEAVPGLRSPEGIANHLKAHLSQGENGVMTDAKGRPTEEAIAFFRDQDLAFRVRRLRLLARRLTQDWETDEAITEDILDAARDRVYEAMSLYQEREREIAQNPQFPSVAEKVFSDPASVLAYIAESRGLRELDLAVDERIAEALTVMPPGLRRPVLLSYLGFPFYDTVTLPLLGGEGLSEFDPVKVDRISPEDARSIREGGTADTLRGTEFFNFGAFFSRAYRENDYLWGRLHGAERMVDLICSTLENTLDADACNSFKRDVFLAVLDEEEAVGRCAKGLTEKLRAEVLERLGT